MAKSVPAHTLSDYVAEAIAPAFIMALVGSLVFFLVEVLYVGQYSANLLWGLFFFVFAAVLIARISIQAPAKARLYGVLLAVPVWLTLQFYVEYPADNPLAPWKWAVHLGLMAVIWWCAHRLTWDCTFIDEDAEVTGTGLLRAAGLEKSAGAEEIEAAEDGKANEAPRGWWERYRRYREERKRKHTPGVWVVYFSLAALPLFGLGQSLIPIEEEGRRRYVFWLMVLYVASGLGLLLTTTFLGLRHYLRQRQVRMPAAVTGVWLTMGGGLVVVLLGLGALLPRPQAEYPLVEIPGLGSPERQASRFAVLGGAPGEGKGRPSSQEPRDQKTEGEPGSQGRRVEGQGQAAGQKSGSGGRGNQDGSGGNQQGQQGGSRGKGQDAQGNGKANSADKRGGEGTGQGKSQEAAGQRGASRQPEGQLRDGGGRQAKEPDRGQARDQQSLGGQRQSGQAFEKDQASPPSDKSFLGGLWSALAALAPILKWVVFIAFCGLVAFVLLRGLLQFLANFTKWARDLLNALRAWWQGLFGGRNRGATEEEAGDVVHATPPRPFASYANPFADGSAGRLSPHKLVRYTFEAFQAWAYEQHLGRRPDETPLEFAARVGQEVPGLEADAERLATLYARALYARGPLPPNAWAVLEQFWKRLEAVAEQPLSA
jgi:hypothetical protein